MIYLAIIIMCYLLIALSYRPSRKHSESPRSISRYDQKYGKIEVE